MTVSILNVILYLVIFVAAILLIEGLAILLRDASAASNRSNNARARLLASGLAGEEALQRLQRQKLTGIISELGLSNFGWHQVVEPLDRLLDESGLLISTQRFLILIGGAVVGLFVLFQLGTTVGIVFSVVVSILLGISMPILYAMRERSKRLSKFGAQLPDALDMVVRSLRAGHPIRTAFGLVAKEMSDPIGTEFGILFDQITYGLDLSDALENMGRRVNLPDLHYMIVTINIQHGTGGDLAEVLGNLSDVIRDRFRLFKKVRALSAEGRLAGMVIAGVPFFIAGIMHVNNPSYYPEAAKDPTFPYMMMATLVLYLGAMYVIYRIVQIRV